jgi:hypothetical protein
MTFDELLHVIVCKFRETHNHGIGRTRLIKLAYLADVFHKRLTGERLVKTAWIFWHYGPYVPEYPEILGSPAFLVEDKGEYENILPAPNWSGSKPTADEEVAISRAMKLADEDFNELLDFVYFDTEPMMNASERGQPLNFDSVKPEEAYTVRRYVISKESQKEIRARLGALRAKRDGR